jgi:hypothetical protein
MTVKEKMRNIITICISLVLLTAGAALAAKPQIQPD